MTPEEFVRRGQAAQQAVNDLGCGALAVKGEQAKHTSGPWAVGEHFAERLGCRTYIPILRPGNDPVPIGAIHRDVDGYGRAEGEANARLIAAAPAQEIIIALIRHGLARFEGIEFCFSGLRYSHCEDWNRLLDVIGWDKARAVIAKAEGRAS